MFTDIIAPLFSTTWGRRSGWVILMLSGLLLFISLIKIPMSLYQDWILVHPKNTPKPASSITLKTANLPDFTKLYLFGFAAPHTVEHLPVTSLPVSLVGILHADFYGQSRVIIADGNQRPGVYKINDILPSGVRITAIGMESVTLENAGRMERLPLQRTMLSFKSVPQPMLLRE